ncbi:MAG: type II secretion system protein GspG [Kiritimatiellia bacterium]|jgi:hypothetical protein|nr:type II secretion system protein GspG [Kiritimatiellia bacterium]MDX9794822.1 type II secretion system protein GspG [Kiritimatiellia bacterium]
MPHARIALIAAGVLIITTLLFVGHNIINNFGSEPAQKAATLVTMREILSSVLQYRREYHRWPVGKQDGSLCFTNDTASDVNNIGYSNKMMMHVGSLTDAWGTPFFVTASDRRFSLTSAGPDGISNTTDDITGWVPADKGGSAVDDSDITIVPL